MALMGRMVAVVLAQMNNHEQLPVFEANALVPTLQ